MLFIFYPTYVGRQTAIIYQIDIEIANCRDASSRWCRYLDFKGCIYWYMRCLGIEDQFSRLIIKKLIAEINRRAWCRTVLNALIWQREVTSWVITKFEPWVQIFVCLRILPSLIIALWTWCAGRRRDFRKRQHHQRKEQCHIVADGLWPLSVFLSPQFPSLMNEHWFLELFLSVLLILLIKFNR